MQKQLKQLKQYVMVQDVDLMHRSAASPKTAKTRLTRDIIENHFTGLGSVIEF